MFKRHQPTTISELRKALIEDSIARKKLVDKLVAAVRADERDRVWLATEKTRRQAEAERG